MLRINALALLNALSNKSPLKGNFVINAPSFKRPPRINTPLKVEKFNKRHYLFEALRYVMTMTRRRRTTTAAAAFQYLGEKVEFMKFTRRIETRLLQLRNG